MAIVALLLIFLILFIVLPFFGFVAVHLIWLAIIGLVIGGLGRLLVPGTRNVSLLMTLLTGLIGSTIGGWIARGLHQGFVVSLILEVVVAALLVLALTGYQRRRLPAGG